MKRWAVILTLGVLSGGMAVSCGEQQPPTSAAKSVAVGPAAGEESGSVEEEVLRNILDQPAGVVPFRAMNYPEDFLRRVADRIIRESYREYAQVVYRDEASAPMPPDTYAADVEEVAADGVRVVVHMPDARLLDGPEEVRPEVAGWRWDESADLGPMLAPDLNEREDRVARHVAARLASQGVVATAIEALRMLGLRDEQPHDVSARLRRVGIPVDLLLCFQPVGLGAEGSVLDVLMNRLRGSEAGLTLGDLEFDFVPPESGFVAAAESGQSPIALMRVQFTRDTYWRGPGAGGCVDLARQLCTAIPDADLLISTQRGHAAEVARLVQQWGVADRREAVVVSEPLLVAQWAADNGKAGLMVDVSGGQRAAMLRPRYASRREDGSVFVAGETLLAGGLAQAGLAVVASPLLFQGGNMLVVEDPATGGRLLLLGEAEVYRNTALGLTREEVAALFTSEMGVDETVVLETVSFHLDFDVSLRAHDGRVIAFINDEVAAVRMILTLAAEALARAGRVDEVDGARVVESMEGEDYQPVLALLGAHIYALRDVHGRYPLSLAQVFSRGAVDSPVGNLQRVLTAMEIATAMHVAEEDWPPGRHARSNLQALQRKAALRSRLHERLAGLGYNVVMVPGLVEGDRSISSVNAVHGPGIVLLPAYGGFFEPLDAAASVAYERSVGDGVRILPVLTGESQRRFGAIHCSIQVFSAGLSGPEQGSGGG